MVKDGQQIAKYNVQEVLYPVICTIWRKTIKLNLKTIIMMDIIKQTTNLTRIIYILSS